VAVPKAAVDLNHRSILSNDDVGFSREAFDVRLEIKLQSSEDASDDQFGFGI
jgi:hypothetical protein